VQRSLGIPGNTSQWLVKVWLFLLRSEGFIGTCGMGKLGESQNCGVREIAILGCNWKRWEIAEEGGRLGVGIAGDFCRNSTQMKS